MSRERSGSGAADAEAQPARQAVCGIVMPIAAMGEQYPEDHWRRVRSILQRAVERAGMKVQLVWDNPEVDVIQSAILQNLYENDIVICDVSGLNPNVMLEAGLRLSTKKPTIIVTDRQQKPPFDISTIGYIEYQLDLEYNAIEDFLDRLQKKISAVHQSYIEGNYKSFVEQFKFETVTPSTVNVSAEKYFKDHIDALSASVRRIESKIDPQPARVRTRPDPEAPTRPHIPVANIRVRGDEELAGKIEEELDDLHGFGICTARNIGDGEWLFTIPASLNSTLTMGAMRNRIAGLLAELGVDDWKLHFS